MEHWQLRTSGLRNEPGGQNSRVKSHVDIVIVFKTVFKLEVDKRFESFEQAVKLDFLVLKGSNNLKWPTFRRNFDLNDRDKDWILCFDWFELIRD